MALTTITNCPVCKSSQFEMHSACADYTTTQEIFSLKKCTACHFVFTDPRPDDTSLGQYYNSEKYISHTGRSQGIISKIYLLARKFTLTRKQKLIEEFSAKKNVLDVGCGTGEFLNQMKQNGWSISGIEPAPNARQSAEKNTQTKVYKSLNDIPTNNFSAITLWHVLEHLPDLNQSIQQLHNLLDDSGTIFIAVPNLKSYDARYYQSSWAGYDVPRHLWHFDKENMKLLLANNKLRLIKILPMKLDSFYVSLLSESYKNPRRWKPFQFLTAFIVGLKSNLQARKTLEYSSLIYIAKR